ncbi:MAG: DNA gyrase inhibitor YacG [Sodalis sp. Ffu]|nr:MAG: DNA gyrase inhibitor YacG [Sodalis sp. Ffu]
MSDDITIVACPTCGIQVEWSENSPFRPFCNKRCQLIDLVEWAEEKKRISSDLQITHNEDWSDANSY